MNGTVGLESGLKLIRPSPLAHSHFRAAVRRSARSWGCLGRYQSAFDTYAFAYPQHFWHCFTSFSALRKIEIQRRR